MSEVTELGQYYRYFDSIHTPYSFTIDGDYESCPNMATVKIFFMTYPVIKKTPKGVWIGSEWGEKHFVLNSSKKKFAHPTETEAKASFKLRKINQIHLLKNQLRRAELALKLAESETGQTEIYLSSLLSS